MSSLAELLRWLLQLGKEVTPLANVAGIINIATLSPIVLWTWAHRDEMVEFRANVGLLCALAIVGLFYLELLRRSNSRNGDH